jgi:serine protease AprX
VTNQAIGADQVQAGLAGLPGLTGAGVGIAVIDSGIAQVPALHGRVVASVDFTDDRGRGGDQHGHGTHVAGIAAAAGTGAQDDTRGVAPGAHLVSLRVLDARGRGYADDVIEAIDWAIEHREQYQIGVINLSLGGPVLQSWRDDPLCQAVERAYRAGIVVVASAGNFGKDATGRAIYGGITAPGNSPFAITVGALNTAGTPWRSDDTRASYSSMGPTQIDHVIKPDLLAPGNRIRGLLAPGSTLATEHPELVTGHGVQARLELSGTSMAAPVVSGAIATLIEGTRLRGYSRWSPAAFRILLQFSAEPIVRDGILGSGAGSVNVAAAGYLQSSGAVRTTLIAGESVATSQFFFGSSLLWSQARNILWGTDENILWGTDKNILWGTGENILWGTGENILWGTDENILWGTGENILWGTAKNILWGTNENILWGTGENILWGTTTGD